MGYKKWGEVGEGGGRKRRGRGKEGGKRKTCLCSNSQPLVLNLHFW